MSIGDYIDGDIVLQELEFNVTIGVQTFGWHAGQMAYEGDHKRVGPFLKLHNQLVADSVGIHHVGCRTERIEARHQRGGR